MVRDEELNRLVRYAQGMGISVHFKPYIKNSHTEAEWAVDGSEITIFTRSNCSKIEKVFSLIHEIAHHKGFVNNGRKLNPKYIEALEELDSEESSKKNRKLVLDTEVGDMQYWEEVYRDTNCQFNIKMLDRQKELDAWTYEVYYETGKDVTKKERMKKKKELRQKYGF